MPRKSKDELNKNEIKDEVISKKSTKSSNKTTLTKETSSNKKSVSKNSNAKKSNTSLKENVSSKSNNKKSASKKTSNNTKKTTNKKKTNAKTTKTSLRKTNSKNKSTIVEYYDLPFRYNETVVKILAQIPTMLFIYWDISDSDRNSYIEKYGEDFFSKTKPVLLITNKTMNYHFEVEINDFANSWYLHVNDANCDYSVELGRRPIEYNSNIDNYVYITTSNDMEMPNNHILFDKLGKTVFFKNVKNNFIEEKEISSISFIKNMGKIYDIYDLYMEMYKNEINVEDLASNDIKLNLSSSNSSTFK